MSATALNTPLAQKFGRFVMVGGTCTGLQYLILIALVQWLHVAPAVASSIGYAISSALNYFLSHRFTYESAASHRRAAPRFLAVTLCGLALNGALVYLLATVYGVNYLIAQLVATAAALVWNFSANLLWTF